MKILITGGNGNLAKIIYNSLKNTHDIKNPNRQQLNLLDFQAVYDYLNQNNFDILIHTAINGGRRNKEENCDIIHNNLIMWENLLYFQNKFKMIIQFDSGAIYDRTTDIMNRKENDLLTIPKDYYGFSKYIIYKRSLYYDNVFNLRIFNIFHENEEADRFIKKCYISKKNNSEIVIFEDKYFDFVYKDDFTKIIEYYINNANNQSVLPKTLNISYEKKYKLSEIAELILGSTDKIIINNKECKYNYCGDNSLLKSLELKLDNLEVSLKKYGLLFNTLDI